MSGGADSLGPELLAVVARLTRWATSNATMEVTPAQGRLLAQVEASQPVRIGDLARADHCSQPTMTAQVSRLEGRGWLTRCHDQSDARAVLITLTSAGGTMLGDLRRARSAVVKPLIEGLGPDQRRTLADATRILSQALDAASDSGDPRRGDEN